MHGPRIANVNADIGVKQMLARLPKWSRMEKT